MKKIVIAGGGITGLSAAVFLSQKNYEIELIEASPSPGGRTRSFYDSELGCEIDNGQHLLLGCYRNTLDLLMLTEWTRDLLIIEELKIPFVERDKRISYLRERIHTYPINIISALLNFNLLSYKEKFHALELISGLKLINENSMRDTTVKAWLEKKNQSRRICDILWDPLAISTMNANPENASAKIFIKILKEVFLKERKGSNFIIPQAGLSKLFVEKNISYLRKRGVKIHCSERITELFIQGKHAMTAATSKRKEIEFDDIVFALPPHALKKIKGIPESINSKLSKFEYSPIITVYLKIKANSLMERFYSFVKSKIQWVFNHGDYLSVVISAANDWVDLTSEEIVHNTKQELKQYLGLEPESFGATRVIKERRATVVLDPERVKERSLPHEIDNLHIVGDWTDTGYPATIEGGILSAKRLTL